MVRMDKTMQRDDPHRFRKLQIECEIFNLTHQADPLPDWRIKIVRPGGTAGKGSQQKGYPRLIHTSGKSRSIAPHEVSQYQSRINAARKIKKLEREWQKLRAS